MKKTHREATLQVLDRLNRPVERDTGETQSDKPQDHVAVGADGIDTSWLDNRKVGWDESMAKGNPNIAVGLKAGKSTAACSTPTMSPNGSTE